MQSDESFMDAALAEATRAGAAGDVPVGAVVVVGGIIIGRGGNRRERDADPTAHAEILAIREAARHVGGWRILDATLYVTQEPCPMCAGAIVNGRIDRVVFGCENPKSGAAVTLYRLLDDPRLNHRAKVEGGLKADEGAKLLKTFFLAARRKPKAP